MVIRALRREMIVHEIVVPKARRRLQDQLHCKIVKLNLTLLRQIDFHKLSTWIDLKDQAESGR